MDRRPSRATAKSTAGGAEQLSRAGAQVGVKDVAREAGVSLGTVSNVLNRPEIVAERTRSRVLEAIDALGYVRAEGARQLRGWASRAIAVLVPDLANPFYTALAAGVEQAAYEADLGIIVCTGVHDPAQAARHLSLLASHQIRGAVLSANESDGHTVAALRTNAVPHVLVDQYAPRPGVCSVGIDDVAGGYAAAIHLIGQGHRSLVHVSGPNGLQQAKDRREGILRALATAGLPPAAMTELQCPALTLSGGRDAGRRILDLPHRPSAVLCASDLLAIGVLDTLHEAGLRVPYDLAVVGCDDIEFAASAIVPLTSLRRPATTMGLRAGRLLIEETAHSTIHEHTHVVLEPALVVRRSSSSAPARPATWARTH